MYQQLRSIIGIIVLMFVVDGCGGRKREVSQKGIEKVSVLNHKTTETERLDITTAAVIIRKDHTVTYTPVDPKQPILTEDEKGNRRQVQNAVITIKQDQEETQRHQTDRSTIQRTAGTEKGEVYQKKETLGRTETSRPLIPWYAWVLAIVVLGFGFFQIKLKR